MLRYATIEESKSLLAVHADITQFTYANNTLRTVVTGTYEDNLPLANVTIAGIEGRPGSLYINCFYGANQGWQGHSWGPSSGARLTYGEGVLFVTGLESDTSGGVWYSNLTLQLQ